VLLARPEKKPAQIGLSPLIDVVFLLLIFFVVTTSFRTPELPIELPEAEGEASSEPEVLVVSIDASGEASIESEPIEPSALIDRFSSAQPDAIVVRADGAVSHRTVVRVLDAARRAGVSRVGLAVGGSTQIEDRSMAETTASIGP
jgi:biopolymer transport protein ExbD